MLPRHPGCQSTITRTKAPVRLVSQLHASQATFMPLKTKTLANALAHKPSEQLEITKDSSPSLTSQQHMPRKAPWLGSPKAASSRVATHLCSTPSQGHSQRHSIVPLFSTIRAHRNQPVYSKMFSVILSKGGCTRYPGVHSTFDLTKSKSLRLFPPNATPLSKSQALALSSSCPILSLSPSRLLPGS